MSETLYRIPFVGNWIKQARRDRHKRLGNDPNRVEGNRPYKDIPGDKLRNQYQSLGDRIRASDSGYGLSPLLDRHWMLMKELKHRDIDPDEVWNPDGDD